MEKILSFVLFEARYSPHFSKRLKERIVDLREVSLDTIQRDALEKEIEDQIGPKWKQFLAEAIIKNTEKRMLEKVKFISFPQNSNFAVPVSFLFLDFNGKSYPIEINF
jgi:hypothetical protein